MKKFDAILIGFGKGAKTLAISLADAGKTIAMIERSDKMYGGTCINVGCIPSKSLVYSAGLSQAFGGDEQAKAARYAAAMEKKRRLTAMLRQKNYDKLANHPHITVFTGEASFSSPQSVLVHFPDQTTQELEGEKIFINTGSRPFIPSIPGLSESRRCYLSETLLDLDILPRHLVILGGGYIGMEFASMYTDFGSQVTVIQDGPVFLPREDEEIAASVAASLKKRGVRLLLSAKVLSIADEADETLIQLQRDALPVETLHADAVLIATGRRPNVADLKLAAAKVELTDRGAVKTDSKLRTSNPNIFAMGDVVGGLQFTYISLDDFRIVASQLLGNGTRNTANRGVVPYSVFLSPPFSRVGLSEKEAIEQGFQVKIARLAAAAIPKAQVLQCTDGLLKAVIDAQTDLILGAHLFCAESHEMINLIKIAMDAKLPYTILRDTIYTHPTMSESLNDLFSSLQPV